MQTIIVAGAGMAGARTCLSLRRLGYAGRLILLSGEDREPYDRPPLSKAGLDSPLDTRFGHDFASLDVTLRLGVPARSLDLAARTVCTDDGDLSFDGLVIATGADPIRLPGDGEQLTLRTAHDADVLRGRLVPGAHVLIIGASWMGAEVATAALRRGCRVTCVEAGASPSAAALGDDVGAALTGWWTGIDLRLDCPVHFVGEGGVVLQDGSVMSADVVVTGVGARPATAWLASSSLQLDRGVLVDDRLRTTELGIVAVGDVAAWWSTRWRRHVRVLHWDDAATAPAAAAAALLDDTASVWNPVPYFWSDQFGHRLQFAGLRGAEDQVIRRWSEDGVLQGVAWLQPEGTLSAYLALDRARDMLAARRAIAAAAMPDAARLNDFRTVLDFGER